MSKCWTDKEHGDDLIVQSCHGLGGSQSRCLWSVWCEQQRRCLLEAFWPTERVEWGATWTQRGNAPWTCRCGFHGYTHLARLFLIFLLCLFTRAMCNFLSDMLSVRSSFIVRVGSKKADQPEQRLVFLWRGIRLGAGAAQASLLVVCCCSRPVNSSSTAVEKTRHSSRCLWEQDVTAGQRSWCYFCSDQSLSLSCCPWWTLMFIQFRDRSRNVCGLFYQPVNRVWLSLCEAQSVFVPIASKWSAGRFSGLVLSEINIHYKCVLEGCKSVRKLRTAYFFVVTKKLWEDPPVPMWWGFRRAAQRNILISAHYWSTYQNFSQWILITVVMVIWVKAAVIK